MITVKLKGGLGNQLFQYAYGRAVSLKLETPLILDVSGYDNQSEIDTERELQINCFNLQASISNDVNDSNISLFKRLYEKAKNAIKNTANPYNGYIFTPENLDIKDGSHVEGFWQSEKYFSNIETILRSDLTLKEKLGEKAKLFRDRIKQVADNGGVSASVHIRRCDYTTNKYAAAYHGALDMTYYQRAISTLQAKLCGKQLVLFVFSDDISWVKENLKTDVPFVCVSRPEILDHEELILMGYCNHNIIANSSFSWWGAWLNPKKDKIVIAPKRWVKDSRANTNDVTPLGWIKI
ncbi:MAG: alpha-1,2-fucosyltransferase [bacterium]